MIAAIAAALCAEDVCGGITEETILDAIKAVGVAAVVCVGAPLPVLVMDMIPPFAYTATEPPATNGSFKGLLVTVSPLSELTLPFGVPLLSTFELLLDCCTVPSVSVWICDEEQEQGKNV